MSLPAVRETQVQNLINRKLPELATLERLLKSIGSRARVNVEATVSYDGIEFPLYSVVMGSEDKTAPCLGVFGGVHGLERIGAEVVIAWLQNISELMNWDETFRARLKNSRLVFMPIINPVGIFLTRRSNGNGVDLMRNAPVTADEEPAWLLGGQTYSNILPWYRGQSTENPDLMEIESQAMCNLVKREIFPSRASLTVDVHSGFGSVDRMWFPYAKSRKPPPHLLEVTALKRVFDRSYPNHIYRIEPQAKQYTTHGDLWDYLYDLRMKQGAGTYIPWTLELGSWMWLKKNPRQLFTSLGAFNPIQPHRLQRILRRHISLFDFLHRAVLSPAIWTEFDQETREQLQRRAMDLWYDPER